MNIKRQSVGILSALVLAALSASPLTHAAPGEATKPLIIQEQGSFAGLEGATPGATLNALFDHPTPKRDRDD